MNHDSLNRKQWLEKLMAIDHELARQKADTRLTLVGSAIGILAGQPARTSIALDVWKPNKVYLRTLSGNAPPARQDFDL